MAGFMIGFGSGGFSVGFPSISNISFSSCLHSKHATPTKPAAKAVATAAFQPAEHWLIAKIAQHAVAKLNPQEKQQDAKSGGGLKLARPSTALPPLATAQGAADVYAFSDEQQAAAKPLYLWKHGRCPVYSFHTELKKTGFCHDWVLASKAPVAVVYDKAVADSTPVFLWAAKNARYYYVAETDGPTQAAMKKRGFAKEAAPAFHMPTKGPFSLISPGLRTDVAKLFAHVKLPCPPLSKCAALGSNQIHGFC